MRLTICWTTRGRQRRFYYDICKKFGISDYMSVNHETPCDIRDEDMELLKECEKRGFIQIRNKRNFILSWGDGFRYDNIQDSDDWVRPVSAASLNSL